MTTQQRDEKEQELEAQAEHEARMLRYAATDAARVQAEFARQLVAKTQAVADLMSHRGEHAQGLGYWIGAGRDIGACLESIRKLLREATP